ncbi:hypothetical protein B7P43_G07762 [Cryptotermes secundus]|uniref:RUN domain-containing protein n=1 Tax=Cryptotermes secundus TaxID=105785 RepID=A0A2J7RSL6_9NEOP|nr:uncharacterized protein LOC111875268 [Cryptotermes secundus]PNF43814.1 hypothetical protein B7P43_G07762 [Cryptotermes secundus]
MSVSNPLLRELKGCVLKLVQMSGSSEITDDNAELQHFCQSLERVFQKGLLRNTALGFTNVFESWYWLEQLACQHSGATFNYISSVNAVKASQKVVTPTGRLRLLIRTCLVNRCLHVPVEILVRKRHARNFYDESLSVLGDEILGEIFLSVLLQCSHLQFKLHLYNASFLDSTWLLPLYIKLEFVPCKVLGICACFVSGRAVIVGVESDGVAAEDDKIEIGDVLDELNGNHITTTKRGKLSSIMRKASGQPIVVNIIKAHLPETGDLFPPIRSLLKQAQLDPDELHSRYSDRNKQRQREETELTKKLPVASRPGFHVKYLGSFNTGKHGDVKQIDNAMRIVMFKSHGSHCPALFEIQEIGIKVTENATGKVLLKHSYMEISSCGMSASIPNHFSYIAGDAACNVAQTYTCFVFHCSNEEHIHTILRSIGQGFQRTHFAV